MFDSQLPSPQRFSPTRLAFSALFHAAALLFVVSLRFAAPVAPASARPTHVTLLAPPRITPPLPPRVPPAERPKVRPTEPVLKTEHSKPRAFSTPRHLASVSPRTAPQPLSVNIALPEQSHTAAPVPDPLRTPVALPPPPLIVGKLSTASVASSTTAATSLRATGFSATPDIAASPAPVRTTRAAGFGEVSAATATHKTASVALPSTAVEILSKPRPAYSEEARQLRIEGEVLLQVLFTAVGEARVERILRGLGHGLDEAAITSANHIQFRPALRAGQPVDQTATVHITFQLAY